MLMQSVSVKVIGDFFLPNKAGVLGAVDGGAVKPLELDTTLLGREELKEKDCEAGAGVSNAENLGKGQTAFFKSLYVRIRTSMSQSENLHIG